MPDRYGQDKLLEGGTLKPGLGCLKRSEWSR